VRRVAAALPVLTLADRRDAKPDAVDALTLAGRIVILDEGHITQVGA
jgi:hypothetical protein